MHAAQEADGRCGVARETNTSMNEQQLQGFLNFLAQGQRSLKRRVCHLEALDRLRLAGREPTMPLAFRSQFGEDTLLWELFSDQLDGYFVEVGAYDGLEFSVSYAFEAVGWKGLLIEALPGPARQCAANRPNSRVAHAALSRRGSTGTTSFNVVNGGGGDMYSYHMTGNDHLARVAREGGVATQITVPLTTMDDLLAEHSGPIDFASIDVEGGEIALLEGFDLDRFKPRALLVEENQFAPQSPLTTYLGKLGYVFVLRLVVNNLYLRRDDPAMMQRARQILA
jgi:FkbM family methyltransferase